jgi:Protein of unknown function (DUF1570)
LSDESGYEQDGWREDPAHVPGGMAALRSYRSNGSMSNKEMETVISVVQKKRNSEQFGTRDPTLLPMELSLKNSVIVDRHFWIAMSRHLFLLLPLLLAASATARPRPGTWIEVRSPRFTVVTDSSERQGRRIAAQFERMRVIFQQSYPQSDDDSDSPVLILAVRNKDQFRTLEPDAYTSKRSLPLHGMFVHASEKNYVLMRLDSEAGNPYPVVYHEYTHLFFRQAEERIPLWLNEGLAEFYQNTEIYEQDVLLGEPNQQHLMLLRQEKLLPLTTLFKVDEKSPYYLQEKKGSIFYAECWALIHYLTLKDYGEKASKVLEYTRQVNDNVDPVTAAIGVFGDLRKLQRELEVYIEQRSFNHFEARISGKFDDSGFQVHPITAAQAEMLKADYLAASGRAAEARALLASVTGQDDLSAPASITLAPPAEQIPVEGKLEHDTSDDIPCPLTTILHEASERATEMVDNLQRFTATEQIEHIEFKKNGKTRKSASQLFSFSYVAEIEQLPSGAFWVEEYRLAKTQNDPPPLSDTGTAAFALIFIRRKLEISNFAAWDERICKELWHGSLALKKVLIHLSPFIKFESTVQSTSLGSKVVPGSQ